MNDQPHGATEAAAGMTPDLRSAFLAEAARRTVAEVWPDGLDEAEKNRVREIIAPGVPQLWQEAQRSRQELSPG